MAPPGRESRPEADLRAAESFRGDNDMMTRVEPVVVDGALSRLVYDQHDQAAAFSAGGVYQDAARVEAAAEIRARELLLEQSSDWQRWARTLALKKGPAWAAMIDEAGEL